MIAHFYRFITHSISPGLLIVAQKLPIGPVIEEIELIWSASGASEYRNVLEFVSINPGG